MNKDIKKIEEILEKYRCDGIKGDYVYIRDILPELSTLLQNSEREAVEGFVDNIGWKKPSEVIDLADDVIDGRSLVKQMEAYLQSLESEK